MDKLDYIKLARIIGYLQAVYHVLENKQITNDYVLNKVTDLLKDSYIELEDYVQEKLDKDKKCQ